MLLEAMRIAIFDKYIISFFSSYLSAVLDFFMTLNMYTPFSPFTGPPNLPFAVAETLALRSGSLELVAPTNAGFANVT